jgi:hypothetical protein
MNSGASPTSDVSDVSAERVCVVIWDGTPPEDELRRQLNSTLPLRLVRWQDHTYLSVIEQLHPRVIVAVEPTEELALDVSGLLACLVTSYTPTIVGMAPAVTPGTAPGAAGAARPFMVVRQLGAAECARIAGLDDLFLA